MRRIVVTRGHEPLTNAWKARSFSMAGDFLEKKIETSGMKLDPTYHPTRLAGASRFRKENASSAGFDYLTMTAPSAPEESVFALRAEFENEGAVQDFLESRADEVVGVYADPQISPFPTYCDKAAIGDTKAVQRELGLDALRDAGVTGKGVRVAVVDTGIDGTIIPVAGGWGRNQHYKPGSAAPDHGTMCAYDVRIAAPDARILDYALLQGSNTFGAVLSDAIRAFSALIDELNQEPGPLVVNNSWGLYDRSEDEPVGSPANYSANPNHPFNQIVGALVAAGADVLFAAGNCGADCPSGYCGRGDVGRGKSIHGANSHPDAITVAAVTVDNRRLGYSSQGPGGLSNRKPDLAGYSHFKGFYEVDSGTSAACPVVAGVVAALRQVKKNRSTFPPSSMKGLVQRTAVDSNGSGWDYDLGYGIVNARVAFTGLRTYTTAAAGR